MTCPQTRLILRLTTGELSAAEAREIREHLSVCPACTSTYGELQKTWSDLKAWQVKTQGIDLTRRVLEAIHEVDGPIDQAGGNIIRWPVVMRAVASLGLAVGLGILVGLLIPVKRDQSHPVAQRVINDEQVLKALGLAHFGVDSATGLSPSFGSMEPKNEQEVPS